MAITETSAAYLADPKRVHVGQFNHAMLYTVAATASASANALVVLGPKIEAGNYIMGIDGQHTSGVASSPVDIGIGSDLSAFATQKTLGTNANPSDFKGGVFPYLVSVSDSAVPLYMVTKFGITPGTNTTGVILKYNFKLDRNPY